MTERDLLREQWRAVAHALEVEFIAPFMLPLKTGHYEFAGLLPQFGGGRGMLIDVEYERRAFSAAIDAGFAYSCMSAESQHLPVVPANYIDCHVDWGWSVEGQQPPGWYSNAA